MKHTFIVLAMAVAISATSAIKQATSSAKPLQEQPAAKEEKYRLIVSFISKGAGANSDQRQAFLNYVDSLAKKPAYKLVRWGREGETDYCFTLKELSKKEQSAFIAEVKKKVAGSDRVLVEENAVCKHHPRLQTKN